MRATEHGLANQGWKDSDDAVFHADGRLAEGAIALAEVQGYVYAAKRMAACCARRIGREIEADKLDAQANKLAEQFEAAFWCPEIETYALALDGAKKPCAVRTSNAGQVLLTGIAHPARAALVAKSLLRPDFFSGWGIRTVARGEARYNPMSYHDGSIWPHDNALIALGFARYGLKRPIDKLFEGLFHAGTYMDHRRLPELFCGFRRQPGQGPTLYPVACTPQAWAAATPFALLQACLGLEFDPFANEIRLNNPRLPAFLDEVMLRDLQLGASYMDLRVRRHGETFRSIRRASTAASGCRSSIAAERAAEPRMETGWNPDGNRAMHGTRRSGSTWWGERAREGGMHRSIRPAFALAAGLAVLAAATLAFAENDTEKADPQPPARPHRQPALRRPRPPKSRS